MVVVRHRVATSQTMEYESMEEIKRDSRYRARSRKVVRGDEREADRHT